VRRAALLLVLALASAARADGPASVAGPASAARATAPASAREATTDLYARMSAGDLPGVMRYVPATGFTELDGDAAAPRRIDAAAFAGLFKSGAHVALRVGDMQEQPLGDVVVVTGVRLGAVTPPGATAPDTATPFTMVWQRDGDGWLLRHVHLSKSAPAR
jgi:ketosteroid isomerase-like protein